MLVIEGLLLFASPGIWKRMADQLQQMEERTLRQIGAAMIVIGLIVLNIVY